MKRGLKRGAMCRCACAIVLSVAAVAAFFCSPSTAHAGPPDVPDKLPQPFAVLPFENRSGLTSWDWMRVGMAFALAEKAEGVSGLRPSYGELIVPEPEADQRVDEATVAAFAGEMGAMWIFSGWVQRTDWKLEIGVSLWRVNATGASRVGEVVGLDESAAAHKLVGRAIRELSQKAGLTGPRDREAMIDHEPSKDFYAFTIFGRGLRDYRRARTDADLKKAQKVLERAVLIDPAMTEGQRVLASLYQRIGKAGRARERLEFALGMRPDYAPALLALARDAQKQNQGERARELYEQVLSLRPWDLETRFRLGQLHWDSSRPDLAFEQLEMVTKHQPAHVRARRTLVLIHASRSDQKGLIRELEAVAKLAPSDINTKLDLAAAYASSERVTDAVATYREIVDLDADNVQALKFLGDLYKKQGSVERAIRYYGLAMKADPKDPRPYFLLAASYVEAGDDQAARRVYLRAQQFPRFRSEAYNNLGAIAYRQGKLKESLWYLQRAVRQEPKSVRYRYNLALSQSASNDTAAALENIAAALDMHPDHVELNYLKGVALLRQGQAEEARKSFQRTLVLDQGHANAKHNLAMLDALERRATEGEVVIEGK